MLLCYDSFRRDTLPRLEDQAITCLLNRWSEGDSEASRELLAELYGELRRIAAAQSRNERRDHTLQPTAIVHEMYLRLEATPETPHWRSRTHFLAIAARLMRQLLVDHSRRRASVKRIGGRQQISLDKMNLGGRIKASELIALDDALLSLGRIDPECSRIVELRFFGGLTLAEVAEYMEISVSTVEMRWRRARAWLYEQLRCTT